MPAITKIHKLLADEEWSHDLRYRVEDYLEANCTVQEIVQLCVYANQPAAVPPTGRLDKLDMLENLLPRVIRQEVEKVEEASRPEWAG